MRCQACRGGRSGRRPGRRGLAWPQGGFGPTASSSRTSRTTAAWVIRTRLAQGLPARVEDPAVLALIADLICIELMGDQSKGGKDQ
jgi:hypothetical protein